MRFDAGAAFAFRLGVAGEDRLDSRRDAILNMARDAHAQRPIDFVAAFGEGIGWRHVGITAVGIGQKEGQR